MKKFIIYLMMKFSDFYNYFFEQFDWFLIDEKFENLSQFSKIIVGCFLICLIFAILIFMCIFLKIASFLKFYPKITKELGRRSDFWFDFYWQIDRNLVELKKASEEKFNWKKEGF